MHQLPHRIGCNKQLAEQKRLRCLRNTIKSPSTTRKLARKGLTVDSNSCKQVELAAGLINYDASWCGAQHLRHRRVNENSTAVICHDLCPCSLVWVLIAALCTMGATFVTGKRTICIYVTLTSILTAASTINFSAFALFFIRSTAQKLKYAKRKNSKWQLLEITPVTLEWTLHNISKNTHSITPDLHARLK